MRDLTLASSYKFRFKNVTNILRNIHAKISLRQFRYFL